MLCSFICCVCVVPCLSPTATDLCVLYFIFVFLLLGWGGAGRGGGQLRERRKTGAGRRGGWIDVVAISQMSWQQEK